MSKFDFILQLQDVNQFIHAHIHFGDVCRAVPGVIALVPPVRGFFDLSACPPREGGPPCIVPILEPFFNGTGTWEGNFTASDLNGPLANLTIADFVESIKNGSLHLLVHTVAYPAAPAGGAVVRGQLGVIEPKPLPETIETPLGWAGCPNCGAAVKTCKFPPPMSYNSSTPVRTSEGVDGAGSDDSMYLYVGSAPQNTSACEDALVVINTTPGSDFGKVVDIAWFPTSANEPQEVKLSVNRDV